MYENHSRAFLCVGVLVLILMMGGCERKKNGERAPRGGGERQTEEIYRIVAQSTLPFKPEQFKEAVRLYASGALKGNGGLVRLPDSLADTTADGCMYVTRGTSSGNLYLFATWLGKGSNLRGYLFHKIDEEHPNVLRSGSIEVLCPRPGLSRFGKAPIARVEIEIENMSTPGWYKASRSLD